MKCSVLFLFSSASLFLAGCQSKIEPVMGRVGGAHLGTPRDAEVITRPAPGGGVRLSTNVGEGKRAVTLVGPEAVRLISALEVELKAFPSLWRSEPFERTIAMGITSTSDWTPYSVELIRRPEMSAAVFRVTIGYADASGRLILDEANARRWVERLKEAAGYQGVAEENYRDSVSIPQSP